MRPEPNENEVRVSAERSRRRNSVGLNAAAWGSEPALWNFQVQAQARWGGLG
jgi:hypothetical protein